MIDFLLEVQAAGVSHATMTNGQFRFLNLDALIASKKAVGRDRDLTAVRSLLAIKERNFTPGPVGQPPTS